MKSLFSSLFALLIICPAFSQDFGPIVKTSVQKNQLVLNTYNDSTIDKQCSILMKVSLLDEDFLNKGFQDVKFSNYLFSARSENQYIFDLYNLITPEMNLNFGELTEVSPIFCKKFTGTIDEVSAAVEGALRNSDIDSAQQFLNTIKDNSQIKVIDVKNSFYNISDGESALGLNHIEIENTTLTKLMSPEEKVCSERKSLKCGKIYAVKASPACGVKLYNAREHKDCGCKTRSRDSSSCTGGCKCKTYKTCRLPKFGVEAYYSCENEAHGLIDAKTCGLEVTEQGAFKSCTI